MFQCLVDFQHLCRALCHFVIKFIFGEPVRKRKSGLRAVSPTWYPSFIVFLAQASPAYAANHLLRTQQTARLQTQPLSPKDNKWRFISSANSSPKLLLLGPAVVREPVLPSILAKLLDFTEDRGHRKQGTNACCSGLLQPLRSLEHHRQSATKFSLMKT